MKELNTFRKFLNEGIDKEEVNEGIWSLGSSKNIKKVLDILDKVSEMGGVKGSLALDKYESTLYNVVGDDIFHDHIDTAKDEATDDDRFRNAISDAYGRAKELLELAMDKEGIKEEELEEGFGDQVGKVLKGAGEGLGAIIKAPMEIVISLILIIGLAGYQVFNGLAYATGLSVGFGIKFLMAAYKKLIKFPMIESTLKRLSEDPEVMEFAKKPSKGGLRKFVYDKLTPAERLFLGNWVKDELTRANLGVRKRWDSKKSKYGTAKGNIGMDTFQKMDTFE